MRFVAKALQWLVMLAFAAIAGVFIWLYVAPPALIRVGTGYSAKIVCSNSFLASRPGEGVLATDVQAPGHPLLKYVGVSVDPVARTVSASLLRVLGESRAVYRPGLGCVSVPDGGAVQLAPLPPPAMPNMAAFWPAGERTELSQDPALAAVLDDVRLTGPGMRAVVVVRNGRIVGERYGEGFDDTTPLLGWSMTKTVNAAIIGTLVGEGRLSLDQNDLFERWGMDERSEITIAHLMAMSGGLEFDEDYGDVTDVTRMLYLESDMADFAANKPLTARPGGRFSYSSGTAVMLSRIWQDAFDDPAEALAWPRERLFGPLGMTSAVLEADASGTFVGSSYMYATARDWARFGEFLRREGRWDMLDGAGNYVEQAILPDGFVSWMREPAPASAGVYGRGQLWLKGPGESDADAELPADAFWLRGHDGQSITIIPSRSLVVVRLGLTPGSLAYRPQPMVSAILSALE